MAAKTPDSIKGERIGNMRMLRLTFSATNLDDTDTVTVGGSTFPFVGAWFAPTTTTGVVGISHSAGVLTVACSAANQVGTLYVLCRG